MTMTSYPIHINFPGRLIFIGFGSIGQGVLPLILRHIGITTDRITVLAADEDGAAVAAEYGCRFVKHTLTRENYKRVLDPLVSRWSSSATRRVRFISTRASSRGRAATPTRPCLHRSVRTTRCARKHSRCGTRSCRDRRPC
jgi:hypothetical protein